MSDQSNEPHGAAGRLFRRILVPVDFSAESRLALLAAVALRDGFGGEVHLFVESRPEQASVLRGLGVQWGGSDSERESERMLRYFAESAGVDPAALIQHATWGDDVVGGITDAVAACAASLVVLGVHDRKSFWRTRAERIVKALDVPVLLLQGEREPLGGT